MSDQPIENGNNLSIPVEVIRPSGRSRVVEADRLKAGATNLPLVSCLMVSRGDLHDLRYSLACYLQQDYRNREFVLVCDQITPALLKYLGRFPKSGIRVIEAPVGLSLGELRNISVAEANGELVCIWDDDDLHDPFRISISVSALLASKAPAVFLSRWLLWWPARKMLAISEKRPWEGSMLARKAVVPPYQPLARGEDTRVWMCKEAETHAKGATGWVSSGVWTRPASARPPHANACAVSIAR